MATSPLRLLLTALFLAIDSEYGIEAASVSSTPPSSSKADTTRTCSSNSNDCFKSMRSDEKASPSSSDLRITSDSPQSPQVIFRHILSSEIDEIDPTLPPVISELKKRNAHGCWHKHSTFLDHLLGVHNILRLWGQSPIIGRVGLLHSAYSNSYVNLALFDPHTERDVMKSLIGEEAEELVHVFCIINRQNVVVDTLLKGGEIPSDGLWVPHLRKEGESVYLSPEFCRMLLIFTMADVADQYFGWQDDLFDGMMLRPGEGNDVRRHNPRALWPGISQPGIWMSYTSKLGKVAGTAGKKEEERVDHDDGNGSLLFSSLLPPVFDNCTSVLDEDDEKRARDLYWQVVTSRTVGDSNGSGSSSNVQEAAMMAVLEQCTQLNPWIYEPHVTLAQLHLQAGNYSQAEKSAERAMQLQLMWGTSWDKRLSFPAWVSWTRVLHQRAVERLPWPESSWDVNNFGLVT